MTCGKGLSKLSKYRGFHSLQGEVRPRVQLVTETECEAITFRHMYTGSRLPRVRLKRTLNYNEEVSIIDIND